MNSNQHIPSLLVGKGRVEQATYCAPGIPNYQGNPLIEALPPILIQDETAEPCSPSSAFNSERTPVLCTTAYSL